MFLIRSTVGLMPMSLALIFRKPSSNIAEGIMAIVILQ